MLQPVEMTGDYYSGINIKLLNGISRPPSRCLELGCANGNLGAIIKQKYPHTYYVGIDINEAAIANASRCLDVALRLDLTTTSQDELVKVLSHDTFDLVIAGDVLEHLPNPIPLLESLRGLTTDNADLLICIPNSAHNSVVKRLLTGDFTYDEAGLLDSTHLKLYSPSSALKTILDSGWLPSIYDTISTKEPNDPFYYNLLSLAVSLGVPFAKASYNMQAYQLLIRARKSFSSNPTPPDQPTRISVICPVNQEWQYELNLAKSPGLKEINADIIKVYGAQSAAQAFQIGLKQVKTEFILFVHQDVYLPKNSGYLLSSYIDAIPAQDKTSVLFGFAGLADCALDSPVISRDHIKGLVIDRMQCISGGFTLSACSIDELGVVLHRDSIYAIDESLGWHLWATDLCLQALHSHSNQKCRIVNIPVMHNSLLSELPTEWTDSANKLAWKWSAMPYIHTLCGTISSKTKPSNSWSQKLFNALQSMAQFAKSS